MSETYETNDCGRAADLVGYLYGEATRSARADFERHLSDCAGCRDELAAFARVRASVGELRAELFDAAPRLALSEVIRTRPDESTPPNAAEATTARAASATTRAAPAMARAASSDANAPARPFDLNATAYSSDSGATSSDLAAAVRSSDANAAVRSSAGRAESRSPWAALRAFFTLAPAWLRVASVAAALVLCALAALAVFNAELRFEGGGVAFKTGAWPPPAQFDGAGQTEPAPHGQPAGQEELRARLTRLSTEHEAALRELEETRAQLEDSRAANLSDAVAYDETSASTDDATGTPDVEAGTSSARAAGPGASGTRRTAKSPGASSANARRSRRAAGDEEELPRLLDLLSTAN
jgi:hypothetical protein